MNLQEMNFMYPKFDEFVDVPSGLGRIMKNKKIYTRLLGSFAAETQYGELLRHMQAGNFEEAQKTAHAIKGVTANLSLPLANKLTMYIEGQLKSGNNDVMTEVLQLDTVLKKTVEYIHAAIANIEDIEI